MALSCVVSAASFRGLRAVLAGVGLGLVMTGSALAELRYAGSDTVEPVVEAARIAYARGHAGYRLQIQASGTTPGFRELCAGKVALVGASRPIKPEEAQACTSNGVQYTELPAALDAVVLVVSSQNTWLKDLSLKEIQALFEPAAAGRLMRWKQLRPTLPDLPIQVAGVGIKHGTFSFFSESVGLKGFVRSDFKDFADHGATGHYVAGEVGALGFMPIGDARALEGQVRIIGVDFGAGVVHPRQEEVLAGRYDRLSRIVYFYLNPAQLAKAPAQDVEFVRLLLGDMERFVQFANMIPMRALQYQENIRRTAFTR